MPRYHNINGERVQFTAEEEAARDAEELEWASRPLNPIFLTFDEFESRFTPQEYNDATDYEDNAPMPIRRELRKGLRRTLARGKVDLLAQETSDYLQILVDGGIISAARKDQILTP